MFYLYFKCNKQKFSFNFIFEKISLINFIYKKMFILHNKNINYFKFNLKQDGKRK